MSYTCRRYSDRIWSSVYPIYIQALGGVVLARIRVQTTRLFLYHLFGDGKVLLKGGTFREDRMMAPGCCRHPAAFRLNTHPPGVTRSSVCNKYRIYHRSYANQLDSNCKSFRLLFLLRKKMQYHMTFVMRIGDFVEEILTLLFIFKQINTRIISRLWWRR